MYKRKITVTLLLISLLFLFTVCDDPYTGDGPVGALIVMLDTVPSEEMESLTIHTREVEVIVDIDAEDGTGSHITTDTASRTLIIPGEEGTHVLAQYEVPAGYVSQIRVYPEDITIIYNGQEYPVTLPSEENTGWKIVPQDDIPFYVPAEGKVVIRGTFDPAERLVITGRNNFILHPTIEMYAVESEEILGVETDIILLRVNDGVTIGEVQSACEAVDVILQKSYPHFNIHVLRLPPHLPLIDALDYFNSLSITYVASFSAYLESSLVPNEGTQQHQNTVNLIDTWDRVTGDYRIIVANMDTGVQLDHPDLYMNIWINEGEIPAAMAIVDVDGDGVITFFDLNDPANNGVVADANGNGFIDALDLLDNNSGFENNNDDDANGFIDDLVGWNFVGNNNNPHSSTANGGHYHGTATAGVTCAMTDNNVNVSGTSWQARTMVLRVLGGDNSGTDQQIIAALTYADIMQADITNMSLGRTWQRKKQDHSRIARFDIPSDEWTEKLNEREQLYDFVADMDSLLVVAAGNEAVNLDDGDTYGAICETFANTAGEPHVINVGATSANGTSRASYSCYASFINIYAPGTDWTLLSNNSNTTIASGTSFATPLVSGVAALLATHNNFALRGDNQGIYDRLIDHGQNQSYGILLNADAATDF